MQSAISGVLVSFFKASRSQFKATVVGSFLLAFSIMQPYANAVDVVPPCIDHGTKLAVNNLQVIAWKETSADQFHARGHILGSVTEVYHDATGHHHLAVAIGTHETDTIEVIYNEAFGATPQIKVGDAMEACGDYVTANGSTPGHPASPNGAILHWVHISDTPNHDSGYIDVNGVLYGQIIGQNNSHGHSNHQAQPKP